MAKILVTSALPYINGIKHLGNLVGSMLPADVYSRFMRQRGHDVIYICATDEHGTPAELAAAEKRQKVDVFCAEQSEIQKEIYAKYNLAFDHFGRTSDKHNIETTQEFYKDLDENGYIEERTIKQVYSIDDGRFLPDRYIEGTCPKCGYENARGDQCENCTSVLDPTDLINPRSAISGSTNVEVRESKHLFLKLPELAEEVADWVEKQIQWPQLVTSIAKKWIKEGLRERCITRDLKWGVPVGDRPGFEDKVFYVWFDAPIGYISATKEWADKDPENRDWKEWWQNADDVKYVQFMAKDNIPFHTISFPASILGTKKPWKLVDYIKGFNWLTFYGGKFSTSQKRGVFSDQALAEFPADYWRYWLMANAPESSDSSFTFELFASVINKDLNDTLGNFINRVLKMTKSKLGESVPTGGELTDAENELAKKLDIRIADYTKYMENLEYRKALGELRAIWVEGNNYLDKTAPWTEIKTNPNRAACILRTAINLIRLYGVLASPIIPSSSSKIFEALGLDTNDQPAWPDKPVTEELQTLKAGDKFTAPEPLFRKISDEEISELSEKYGANL
ncbi:MAG: methionine--tRNA ligase [Alphaproteobacteria bacterium]|nr:methionine--tRNA ligase [Alphaproteobacteria bacterium]